MISVLSECDPAIIDRLARAINSAIRDRADREAERRMVHAAHANDMRLPLTRIAIRCEQLDDIGLRAALERDVEQTHELLDASLACTGADFHTPSFFRRIDGRTLPDDTKHDKPISHRHVRDT
jgi:hypothetical protein